jgi:hypothetical protein
MCSTSTSLLRPHERAHSRNRLTCSLWGLAGFGADGTFFSSAADADDALGGALDDDLLGGEREDPVAASSSATSSQSRGGLGLDDKATSSSGAGGARDSERPAWAQALISHSSEEQKSSTRDEAGSEGASPAEADEWFYRDLANEVQGPFSTADMTEW